MNRTGHEDKVTFDCNLKSDQVNLLLVRVFSFLPDGMEVGKPMVQSQGFSSRTSPSRGHCRFLTGWVLSQEVGVDYHYGGFPDHGRDTGDLIRRR